MSNSKENEELLKQLRLKHPDAQGDQQVTAEGDVVEQIRSIKVSLQGFGIYTQIEMIVRGCMINPYDNPLDQIAMDEHYLDRLEEFRRTHDRRTQITPINCMATVLHENPALRTQEFSTIEQIYSVMPDLANILRRFYAEDSDRHLPAEFSMV